MSSEFHGEDRIHGDTELCHQLPPQTSLIQLRDADLRDLFTSVPSTPDALDRTGSSGGHGASDGSAPSTYCPTHGVHHHHGDEFEGDDAPIGHDLGPASFPHSVVSDLGTLGRAAPAYLESIHQDVICEHVEDESNYMRLFEEYTQLIVRSCQQLRRTLEQHIASNRSSILDARRIVSTGTGSGARGAGSGSAGSRLLNATGSIRSLRPQSTTTSLRPPLHALSSAGGAALSSSAAAAAAARSVSPTVRFGILSVFELIEAMSRMESRMGVEPSIRSSTVRILSDILNNSPPLSLEAENLETFHEMLKLLRPPRMPLSLSSPSRHIRHPSSRQGAHPPSQIHSHSPSPSPHAHSRAQTHRSIPPSPSSPTGGGSASSSGNDVQSQAAFMNAQLGLAMQRGHLKFILETLMPYLNPSELPEELRYLDVSALSRQVAEYRRQLAPKLSLRDDNLLCTFSYEDTHPEPSDADAPADIGGSHAAFSPLGSGSGSGSHAAFPSFGSGSQSRPRGGRGKGGGVSSDDPRFGVRTPRISDVSRRYGQIASNGVYLYVLRSTGIFKIGTGLWGTVRGRIYAQRLFTAPPHMDDVSKGAEGWIVCHKGRVIVRTDAMKMPKFAECVSPDTLEFVSEVILAPESVGIDSDSHSASPRESKHDDSDAMTDSEAEDVPFSDTKEDHGDEQSGRSRSPDDSKSSAADAEGGRTAAASSAKKKKSHSGRSKKQNSGEPERSRSVASLPVYSMIASNGDSLLALRVVKIGSGRNGGVECIVDTMEFRTLSRVPSASPSTGSGSGSGSGRETFTLPREHVECVSSTHLPLAWAQLPPKSRTLCTTKQRSSKYYVGEEVDCLDTSEKWYPARIVNVRPLSVYVTYDEWDDKWNEWIPIDSGRIAQRSMSSNRSGITPKVKKHCDRAIWQYCEIPARAAPPEHWSNFNEKDTIALEVEYSRAQPRSELPDVRIKGRQKIIVFDSMNMVDVRGDVTLPIRRVEPVAIKGLCREDVQIFASDAQLMMRFPVGFCSSSNAHSLMRAFSLEDGRYVGESKISGRHEFSSGCYDAVNDSFWTLDPLTAKVRQWMNTGPSRAYPEPAIIPIPFRDEDAEEEDGGEPQSTGAGVGSPHEDVKTEAEDGGDSSALAEPPRSPVPPHASLPKENADSVAADSSTSSSVFPPYGSISLPPLRGSNWQGAPSSVQQDHDSHVYLPPLYGTDALPTISMRPSFAYGNTGSGANAYHPPPYATAAAAASSSVTDAAAGGNGRNSADPRGGLHHPMSMSDDRTTAGHRGGRYYRSPHFEISGFSVAKILLSEIASLAGSSLIYKLRGSIAAVNVDSLHTDVDIVRSSFVLDLHESTFGSLVAMLRMCVTHLHGYASSKPAASRTGPKPISRHDYRELIIVIRSLLRIVRVHICRLVQILPHYIPQVTRHVSPLRDVLTDLLQFKQIPDTVYAQVCTILTTGVRIFAPTSNAMTKWICDSLSRELPSASSGAASGPPTDNVGPRLPRALRDKHSEKACDYAAVDSVLPVKGSARGLLLTLSAREENLGTLLLEDASTKDIKRMKVGESNFMKVVKECLRCLEEEAVEGIKALNADDLEHPSHFSLPPALRTLHALQRLLFVIARKHHGTVQLTSWTQPKQVLLLLQQYTTHITEHATRVLKLYPALAKTEPTSACARQCRQYFSDATVLGVLLRSLFAFLSYAHRKQRLRLDPCANAIEALYREVGACNPIAENSPESQKLYGLALRYDPGTEFVSKLVESVHPVKPEYKYETSVRIPGATCLFLDFDERCASRAPELVLKLAAPATNWRAAYASTSFEREGDKSSKLSSFPTRLVAVPGDTINIGFGLHTTSRASKRTSSKKEKHYGFRVTVHGFVPADFRTPKQRLSFFSELQVTMSSALSSYVSPPHPKPLMPELAALAIPRKGGSGDKSAEEKSPLPAHLLDWMRRNVPGRPLMPVNLEPLFVRLSSAVLPVLLSHTRLSEDAASLARKLEASNPDTPPASLKASPEFVRLALVWKSLHRLFAHILKTPMWYREWRQVATAEPEKVDDLLANFDEDAAEFVLLRHGAELRRSRDQTGYFVGGEAELYPASDEALALVAQLRKVVPNLREEERAQPFDEAKFTTEVFLNTNTAHVRIMCQFLSTFDSAQTHMTRTVVQRTLDDLIRLLCLSSPSMLSKMKHSLAQAQTTVKGLTAKYDLLRACLESASHPVLQEILIRDFHYLVPSADLPVVHPDALVRSTRAFHGVVVQMLRLLPKRTAHILPALLHRILHTYNLPFEFAPVPLAALASRAELNTLASCPSDLMVIDRCDAFQSLFFLMEWLKTLWPIYSKLEQSLAGKQCVCVDSKKVPIPMKVFKCRTCSPAADQYSSSCCEVCISMCHAGHQYESLSTAIGFCSCRTTSKCRALDPPRLSSSKHIRLLLRFATSAVRSLADTLLIYPKSVESRRLRALAADDDEAAADRKLWLNRSSGSGASSGVGLSSGEPQQEHLVQRELLRQKVVTLLCSAIVSEAKHFSPPVYGSSAAVRLSKDSGGVDQHYDDIKDEKESKEATSSSPYPTSRSRGRAASESEDDEGNVGINELMSSLFNTQLSGDETAAQILARLPPSVEHAYRTDRDPEIYQRLPPITPPAEAESSEDAEETNAVSTGESPAADESDEEEVPLYLPMSQIMGSAPRAPRTEGGDPLEAFFQSLADADVADRHRIARAYVDEHGVHPHFPSSSAARAATPPAPPSPPTPKADAAKTPAYQRRQSTSPKADSDSADAKASAPAPAPAYQWRPSHSEEHLWQLLRSAFSLSDGLFERVTDRGADGESDLRDGSVSAVETMANTLLGVLDKEESTRVHRFAIRLLQKVLPFLSASNRTGFFDGIFEQLLTQIGARVANKFVVSPDTASADRHRDRLEDDAADEGAGTAWPMFSRPARDFPKDVARQFAPSIGRPPSSSRYRLIVRRYFPDTDEKVLVSPKLNYFEFGNQYTDTIRKHNPGIKIGMLKSVAQMLASTQQQAQTFDYWLSQFRLKLLKYNEATVMIASLRSCEVFSKTIAQEGISCVIKPYEANECAVRNAAIDAEHRRRTSASSSPSEAAGPGPVVPSDAASPRRTAANQSFDSEGGHVVCGGTQALEIAVDLIGLVRSCAGGEPADEEGEAAGGRGSGRSALRESVMRRMSHAFDNWQSARTTQCLSTGSVPSTALIGAVCCLSAGIGYALPRRGARVRLRKPPTGRSGLGVVGAGRNSSTSVPVVFDDDKRRIPIMTTVDSLEFQETPLALHTKEIGDLSELCDTSKPAWLSDASMVPRLFAVLSAFTQHPIDSGETLLADDSGLQGFVLHRTLEALRQYIRAAALPKSITNGSFQEEASSTDSDAARDISHALRMLVSFQPSSAVPEEATDLKASAPAQAQDIVSLLMQFAVGKRVDYVPVDNHALAVQWSKAFTRRLDLLHMPREALLSGMFREMERDPKNYLDYAPSFTLQQLHAVLKHTPFLSHSKRTPSRMDYSRARGCVFEEGHDKLTGVWYRGHYLNTTRKQARSLPVTLVSDCAIPYEDLDYFYFEVELVSMEPIGSEKAISIGLCSKKAVDDEMQPFGWCAGSHVYMGTGEKAVFERKSPNPATARLEVGDVIDIKDSPTGHWERGVIVRTKPEKVEVRFVEWETKFDEWVPRKSDRLQPYRLHTGKDKAAAAGGGSKATKGKAATRGKAGFGKGQLSRSPYAQPWRRGDVVGCLWDVRDGAMSFTRNGISVGRAFRGISKQHKFAAVCLDAGTRVKVNFGQRPFSYSLDHLVKYRKASRPSLYSRTSTATQSGEDGKDNMISRSDASDEKSVSSSSIGRLIRSSSGRRPPPPPPPRTASPSASASSAGTDAEASSASASQQQQGRGLHHQVVQLISNMSNLFAPSVARASASSSSAASSSSRSHSASAAPSSSPPSREDAGVPPPLETPTSPPPAAAPAAGTAKPPSRSSSTPAEEKSSRGEQSAQSPLAESDPLLQAEAFPSSFEFSTSDFSVADFEGAGSGAGGSGRGGSGHDTAESVDAILAQLEHGLARSNEGRRASQPEVLDQNTVLSLVDDLRRVNFQQMLLSSANVSGSSSSSSPSSMSPIVIIRVSRSLASVSLHELHEGMRVRISSQAKRIVLSQFTNELQPDEAMPWIGAMDSCRQEFGLVRRVDVRHSLVLVSFLDVNKSRIKSWWLPPAALERAEHLVSDAYRNLPDLVSTNAELERIQNAQVGALARDMLVDLVERNLLPYSRSRSASNTSASESESASASSFVNIDTPSDSSSDYAPTLVPLPLPHPHQQQLALSAQKESLLTSGAGVLHAVFSLPRHGSGSDSSDERSVLARFASENFSVLRIHGAAALTRGCDLPLLELCAHFSCNARFKSRSVVDSVEEMLASPFHRNLFDAPRLRDSLLELLAQIRESVRRSRKKLSFESSKLFPSATQDSLHGGPEAPGNRNPRFVLYKRKFFSRGVRRIFVAPNGKIHIPADVTVSFYGDADNTVLLDSFAGPRTSLPALCFENRSAVWVVCTSTENRLQHLKRRESWLKANAKAKLSLSLLVCAVDGSFDLAFSILHSMIKSEKDDEVAPPRLRVSFSEVVSSLVDLFESVEGAIGLQEVILHYLTQWLMCAPKGSASVDATLVPLHRIMGAMYFSERLSYNTLKGKRLHSRFFQRLVEAMVAARSHQLRVKHEARARSVAAASAPSMARGPRSLSRAQSATERKAAEPSSRYSRHESAPPAPAPAPAPGPGGNPSRSRRTSSSFIVTSPVVPRLVSRNSIVMSRRRRESTASAASDSYMPMLAGLDSSGASSGSAATHEGAAAAAAAASAAGAIDQQPPPALPRASTTSSVSLASLPERSRGTSDEEKSGRSSVSSSQSNAPQPIEMPSFTSSSVPHPLEEVANRALPSLELGTGSALPQGGSSPSPPPSRPPSRPPAPAGRSGQGRRQGFSSMRSLMSLLNDAGSGSDKKDTAAAAAEALLPWPEWFERVYLVVANLQSILAGKCWNLSQTLNEERTYRFPCWSLEEYEDLASHLMTLASSKDTSACYITDADVKECAPLLQRFAATPTPDIVAHVSALQRLNSEVEQVLPLIDLGSSWLGDLVSRCRALLFWDTRHPFYESVLDWTASHEEKKSSASASTADGMRQPIQMPINRFLASDMMNGFDERQLIDGPIALASPSIFGQTFTTLRDVPPSKLRPPRPSGSSPHVAFSVQFSGEDALGHGGPYRALFSDLARELMSNTAEGPRKRNGERQAAPHPVPLFVPTENQRHAIGESRELFVPNPACTSIEHLEMFEFVGRLIGVALRTRVSFALDLPSLVWKFACSEDETHPLSRKDLEQIDSSLCSSLLSFLERCDTKEEFEACFGVATRRRDSDSGDSGGNTESESDAPTFTKELMEYVTSEDIKVGTQVTVSTRLEYVRAREAFELHKYDVQILAICRGLWQVVPRNALRIFRWQELQHMVCGARVIDIDLLKRFTEYSGCKADDPHIKNFWHVLREFTPRQLRRFVEFAYASSRLPPNEAAFRQTGVRMMVKSAVSHDTDYDAIYVNIDDQDGMMPRADTCFFNVEIPRYSTLELMRERLSAVVDMDWGMSGDGHLMGGGGPGTGGPSAGGLAAAAALLSAAGSGLGRRTGGGSGSGRPGGSGSGSGDLDGVLSSSLRATISSVLDERLGSGTLEALINAIGLGSDDDSFSLFSQALPSTSADGNARASGGSRAANPSAASRSSRLRGLGSVVGPGSGRNAPSSASASSNARTGTGASSAQSSSAARRGTGGMLARRGGRTAVSTSRAVIGGRNAGASASSASAPQRAQPAASAARRAAARSGGGGGSGSTSSRALAELNSMSSGTHRVSSNSPLFRLLRDQLSSDPHGYFTGQDIEVEISRGPLAARSVNVSRAPRAQAVPSSSQSAQNRSSSSSGGGSRSGSRSASSAVRSPSRRYRGPTDEDGEDFGVFRMSDVDEEDDVAAAPQSSASRVRSLGVIEQNELGQAALQGRPLADVHADLLNGMRDNINGQQGGANSGARAASPSASDDGDPIYVSIDPNGADSWLNMEEEEVAEFGVGVDDEDDESHPPPLRNADGEVAAVSPSTNDDDEDDNTDDEDEVPALADSDDEADNDDEDQDEDDADADEELNELENID